MAEFLDSPGKGENKFSDRPLEGGGDRALNFDTVHLISKHLFHCHFGVP